MEEIRKYFDGLYQLDDENWELIGSCFQKTVYKKGEVLLAEGDVCDFVAFVESGIFRFFHLKEGDEKISGFFFENDMMSNYPSFTNREPSTYYIDCMKDGAVWKIKKEDMVRLFEESHQLERLGRLMAERLFAMIVRRLESFVYETPEQRYQALLAKGSRLIQEIPQYMLASYVGVSAETLSRIRKRITV
ncbi:Crp/Fnr family transcriptional regulator [Flammeovirgaceae bacterium SG7u.111]|nr:Crp/Fnr family transcriptional regulator [Flammeovirgaceae bacterium SG7u.132]WPO34511.1 Crp/Fnr family transcriptional regulator [Flammeovirgaceae bacterium SG7u.111]